jgi:hypothetical protein
MSSQVDLSNKAGECERLMNLEADEVKKLALRLLREIWIALANESATMDPKEVARQIAYIEKIQATVQLDLNGDRVQHATLE